MLNKEVISMALSIEAAFRGLPFVANKPSAERSLTPAQQDRNFATAAAEWTITGKPSPDLRIEGGIASPREVVVYPAQAEATTPVDEDTIIAAAVEWTISGKPSEHIIIEGPSVIPKGTTSPVQEPKLTAPIEPSVTEQTLRKRIKEVPHLAASALAMMKNRRDKQLRLQSTQELATAS